MQASLPAATSAQADQARPSSHAIDVGGDSATIKVNSAQALTIFIVLTCRCGCRPTAWLAHDTVLPQWNCELTWLVYGMQQPSRRWSFFSAKTGSRTAAGQVAPSPHSVCQQPMFYFPSSQTFCMYRHTHTHTHAHAVA